MYFENTNQQQNKTYGKKAKVAVAALLGTACVGVGVAWYNSSEAAFMEEPGTLMNLAEADKVAVMNRFFTSVVEECNSWFGNKSVEIRRRQNEFLIKGIKMMSQHKFLLMGYAKEDYHKVKAQMIKIMDAIKDAHSAVESTEKGFVSRLQKLEKFQRKGLWKYPLKIGIQYARLCQLKAPAMDKQLDLIDTEMGKLGDMMGAMGDVFVAKVKKEQKTRSCDMWKPIKREGFDIGKAIEMGKQAIEIGKQGFDAYNDVKGAWAKTKGGAAELEEEEFLTNMKLFDGMSAGEIQEDLERAVNFKECKSQLSEMAGHVSWSMEKRTDMKLAYRASDKTPLKRFDKDLIQQMKDFNAGALKESKNDRAFKGSEKGDISSMNASQIKLASDSVKKAIKAGSEAWDLKMKIFH